MVKNEVWGMPISAAFVSSFGPVKYWDFSVQIRRLRTVSFDGFGEVLQKQMTIGGYFLPLWEDSGQIRQLAAEANLPVPLQLPIRILLFVYFRLFAGLRVESDLLADKLLRQRVSVNIPLLALWPFAPVLVL